jgi:hypothetical protein
MARFKGRKFVDAVEEVEPPVKPDWSSTVPPKETLG